MRMKKANRIHAAGRILRNRIPAAGLILLIVLASGLAGCGMSVRSSSTTLTIDETGRLREEIVEDQGGIEYSEEELKAFITQEADKYNQQKESEAVSLSSCTVQNGDVKISLEYTSCDDYAAFNQVPCFMGTLQEAEDAGYEVERTWTDPEGVIGDNEIIRERFREWKVVILSEAINVRVPDKILYTSENVDVTGRLSAVVTTVMNEEETESSSAGTSSSSAGTAKTTVYPLATVADRFAYIIYK